MDRRQDRPVGWCDAFIAAHELRMPSEIVLDLDATVQIRSMAYFRKDRLLRSRLSYGNWLLMAAVVHLLGRTSAVRQADSGLFQIDELIRVEPARSVMA